MRRKETIMRKRAPSALPTVLPGCPICTIVPSHMLRHLSRHGPVRLRDSVLQTLQHSERLRGQRDMLAYLGAVALATPTGTRRRTIYDLAHGTRLPGKRARGEGDPRSKDRNVNERSEERRVGKEG